MKRHHLTKPAAGRMAVAALAVAGLAVTLAVEAPAPARAATQIVTVGHNDVASERGELNKVYYSGPWDSNSGHHWQAEPLSEEQWFEIVFEGEAISLFSQTRTTNGQATVYLDDVEVGEYNCYSSSNQSIHALITLTGIGSGEHAVRVVPDTPEDYLNFARAEITQTIPDPEPPDGLEALQAAVDALAAKTATDYTAGSWSAAGAALDAAGAVLADPGATDEDVAAAMAGLVDADSNLILVRGLRELVEKYQTAAPTAYVEGSWADFAAARLAAEGALTDADASLAEIVAAKSGLLEAAGELVAADAGDLLTIQNDSWWYDTDGNPIYSQGGGIFRFGDTYYWYGVRYAAAPVYIASPTKAYSTSNDSKFVAVTCYSSKDLVNWKFENNVLTTDTPVAVDPADDVSTGYFTSMATLDDASWLGRLGVVYNPNTGKFVVITQMETRFAPDNATNHSVAFFTGDSPWDDFEYANVQRQITDHRLTGTGDQTVFTDDDGQSYLISSDQSGRSNAYVSRIAPEDSLSIEPAVRVRSGSGREGNCMFKAEGRYYMATSELFGWNSSHAWLIGSQTDAIQGAYTSEWKMAGTERDYSHTTQTGFFLTVKGTEQDVTIFAGDRWADFAWNGHGYNQWMPVTIEDGAPVFHSLSQWQINATTGEWQVGAGNNYVLNGDFQADRVSISAITGWTTVVDAGSSTGFVTNNTGGANSSRYAARLTRDGAFSGSIYQENLVPDGVYRLSTFATRTAGLTEGRIRVTGGEDEDYVLDLAQAGTSWGQFSLEGLTLTGGAAKVSIEAVNTSGNNNLTVDQLSLVRTGDLPEAAALDLVPVASARCIAGKAYLTVTVQNQDEQAVDLAISSAFGQKAFASVAVGKYGSHAFTTRLVSLPAGEVTVVGQGLDTPDASQTELKAQYSALSCG
ncbi:MAG: family 43 glycosylhydrolase [Bifidobacteriaceae bacterium]|jgi:hypothetical protein|nr:family 43 glycosylhydrolase [Bifidobacteriaceae bacterium]